MPEDLAILFAAALEVTGDEDTARQLLDKPQQVLGGKSLRDVARKSVATNVILHVRGTCSSGRQRLHRSIAWAYGMTLGGQLRLDLHLSSE